MMIGRLTLLGLLAATVGCDESMLGPSGSAGTGGATAGTTGTGGVNTGFAGTTGVGGNAGSGGGGTGGPGVPACGGARAASGMELALVGSDGIAIATDVSSAVTVASVDSCATVSCAWTYPDRVLGSSGSSTTATQFVLTAGSSQRWTLYLRLPDMPSGLVAPGDAFDLIVDAGISGGPYESVYQTVVLTRGGRLAVFASNLMAVAGDPPLPQLDPYGIAIGDDGILCQPDGFGCAERPHAVRATIGTETAAAVAGQTIQIGDLSFTNGLAVDYMLAISGCHMKPASLLGGFMRPTTLPSRR